MGQRAAASGTSIKPGGIGKRPNGPRARPSGGLARRTIRQEQHAHWDKSREEWEQIGKMTLTALALAARAGIAGLNRMQFDDTI